MHFHTLTNSRNQWTGLTCGTIVIAVGLWAQWQEDLVIVGGSHVPTRLQPVAIAAKGTVFYVSEHQASSYALSHDMFIGAIGAPVLAFGFGLVSLVIARFRR